MKMAAKKFNWGSLLAGAGIGIVGNSIFPGLGSLMAGLFRSAASGANSVAGAMDSGSVASDEDVRKRWGFTPNPATGQTWMTFADEQEVQQAHEFYPQHGVSFLASGVTEEGLPALAIATEDTDLALDVSHDFWQVWGDHLASIAPGVIEVGSDTNYGSSGVDLSADLANFDL